MTPRRALFRTTGAIPSWLPLDSSEGELDVRIGPCGGAVFSSDHEHRFAVWREFDGSPSALNDFAVWVMLNPSSADELKLDPTLRRVERFSRSFGHKGFIVLNRYSLVSTNPALLFTHQQPNHPLNKKLISRVLDQRCTVYVGWGNTVADTPKWVLRCVKEGRALLCLGTTACGQPRHPLYLKADSIPVVWSPPGVSV